MSDTTTAESAADQARAKTQEVSTQARDRVRDQVDRRSTEAGEQAGSAAQALRDPRLTPTESADAHATLVELVSARQHQPLGGGERAPRHLE